MKGYVRLLVLFAPRVKFYSERGDTAFRGGGGKGGMGGK